MGPPFHVYNMARACARLPYPLAPASFGAGKYPECYTIEWFGTKETLDVGHVLFVRGRRPCQPPWLGTEERHHWLFRRPGAKEAIRNTAHVSQGFTVHMVFPVRRPARGGTIGWDVVPVKTPASWECPNG